MDKDTMRQLDEVLGGFKDIPKEKRCTNKRFTKLQDLHQSVQKYQDLQVEMLATLQHMRKTIQQELSELEKRGCHRVSLRLHPSPKVDA